MKRLVDSGFMSSLQCLLVGIYSLDPAAFLALSRHNSRKTIRQGAAQSAEQARADRTASTKKREVIQASHYQQCSAL